MLRVVFVCTGNICRSPMAEGILRDEWKKRYKDGLIVTSMGIHGLEDQEPSSLAREVCEERGIDISAHRSRKLVVPELEDAHLILSMEPVHKDFIHLFFPRFKDKNFLLGAWPNKETKKSIIKDPMGSPLKVYQESRDLLYKHILRIIPYLEEYSV